MNKRWTSSNHSVYNCAFHLIWTVKYRKQLLTNGIDTRLKELLHSKAEEHGWHIENLEVMPDHVHVFIKVTPTDAPSFVVSQLKGSASFTLRNEFPILKSRLPALWTRAFYCESVGHISEKKIKKYIDSQKEV